MANSRDLETSTLENDPIHKCSVHSSNTWRNRDYVIRGHVPKRYQFSSGIHTKDGYYTLSLYPTRKANLSPICVEL